MCGTTVYLHDAWAAGSNLAKRDWRRLTSGQVWYCRERQKAPRDECTSAQGENCFLTSALEVYYSLDMWEKSTSTLSHRLVKPPRRCPNPILPQIGAISGATGPCRGRNSSHAWQQWVLQSTWNTGNISASQFLQLLLLVAQRRPL